MKKNYFLSQIFKILFSIFIFAQGQSNNNSFFLSQILVFFLGCFLRHFFSSLKLKYGVVDDLLLYVFCFLSLSFLFNNTSKFFLLRMKLDYRYDFLDLN